MSSQSITISQENRASPDGRSPLMLQEQENFVQSSQTPQTTSTQTKRKPHISIISRGNEQPKQQVTEKPPQPQPSQPKPVQKTQYYLEFSEDS